MDETRGPPPIEAEMEQGVSSKPNPVDPQKMGDDDYSVKRSRVSRRLLFTSPPRTRITRSLNDLSGLQQDRYRGPKSPETVKFQRFRTSSLGRMEPQFPATHLEPGKNLRKSPDVKPQDCIRRSPVVLIDHQEFHHSRKASESPPVRDSFSMKRMPQEQPTFSQGADNTDHEERKLQPTRFSRYDRWINEMKFKKKLKHLSGYRRSFEKVPSSENLPKEDQYSDVVGPSGAATSILREPFRPRFKSQMALKVYLSSSSPDTDQRGITPAKKLRRGRKRIQRESSSSPPEPQSSSVNSSSSSSDLSPPISASTPMDYSSSKTCTPNLTVRQLRSRLTQERSQRRKRGNIQDRHTEPKRKQEPGRSPEVMFPAMLRRNKKRSSLLVDLSESSPERIRGKSRSCTRSRSMSPSICRKVIDQRRYRVGPESDENVGSSNGHGRPQKTLRRNDSPKGGQLESRPQQSEIGVDTDPPVREGHSP